MKKNRVTAAILAFILSIGITVPAYAETDGSLPQGWAAVTLSDYIFRIAGSEAEFILLDSDEDSYYVLAKDSYGFHPFDTAGNGRFDSSVKTNIAYWLNNEFVEQGNMTGAVSGKTYSLPAEVLQEIDYRHVWKTENDNNGYDTAIAGIGLLSEAEALKYNGIYGIRDNLTEGQPESGACDGWLLRTMANSREMKAFRFGVNTGKIGRWATDANLTVRPSFYLKKDFFERVKCDVDSLGFDVREKICESGVDLSIYTPEEQQKIKSYRDLKRYNDKPLDFVRRHGVATHFAQGRYSDSDILMMKAAGIKLIRDEVYWSIVEQSKGVYSFESPKVNYLDKLSDYGIDAVVALDYGNSLYCDGAPNDGSSIQAYANFCAAVAERFTNVKQFEIWNEPNLKGFWGRTPSAQEYAELVKAASAEIRKVRPDAKVIGGVVSDYNGVTYMKTFLENIDYKDVDAVSIHPYHYHDNGTQAQHEARLVYNKNLIDSFGPFKEMYITEIGWPTVSTTNGYQIIDGNKYTDISEERQALEIVKGYVLGDSHDVAGYTIYDFKNDGTDKSQIEQNFGLIDFYHQPKKSYYAVKEFQQQTAGAQYMGSISGTDIHIYRNQSEYMAVAWGSAGNYNFSNPVAVYDIYGSKIAEGKTVKLSSTPVYIKDISCADANKAVIDSAALFADDVPDVKLLLQQAAEGMDFDTARSCLEQISDKGLEIISGGVSDSSMRRLENLYKTADAVIKVAYSKTDAAANTDCKKAIELTKLKSMSPNFDYASAVLKKARDEAAKTEIGKTGYRKNAYADYHNRLSLILVEWARSIGKLKPLKEDMLHVDVTLNSDNVVTVKGESANDILTGLMLNPGVSEKNLSQAEANMFNQLVQRQTDSDGEFSFSYPILQNKGNYNLRIYSEKNNDFVNVSVPFYAEDEMPELKAVIFESSITNERVDCTGQASYVIPAGTDSFTIEFSVPMEENSLKNGVCFTDNEKNIIEITPVRIDNSTWKFELVKALPQKNAYRLDISENLQSEQFIPLAEGMQMCLQTDNGKNEFIIEYSEDTDFCAELKGYKLSNTEFNAIFVLAGYENNRLTKVELKNIMIGHNEAKALSECLRMSKGEEYYKAFLWENMKPAAVRK